MRKLNEAESTQIFGGLAVKPTQDILYLYCYYSLQQNLVLQEILMALQACYHLQLPHFMATKAISMCQHCCESVCFKRRLARSTMFLRQSISEQETDLASQIAEYSKGRIEGNWDLAQAIEQLPMKQQIAIALHYYQGMTVPEISEALHISENTIKKRIQAALSNLRLVLRDVHLAESLTQHQGCIA